MTNSIIRAVGGEDKEKAPSLMMPTTNTKRFSQNKIIYPNESTDDDMPELIQSEDEDDDNGSSEQRIQNFVDDLVLPIPDPIPSPEYLEERTQDEIRLYEKSRKMVETAVVDINLITTVPAIRKTKLIATVPVTIPGRENHVKLRFLLDTGSQGNLMIASCVRNNQFPITTTDEKIMLADYQGNGEEIINHVTQPLQLGGEGTMTNVQFLILKDLGYPIDGILGIPFIQATSSSVITVEQNEETIFRLQFPDSGYWDLQEESREQLAQVDVQWVTAETADNYLLQAYQQKDEISFELINICQMEVTETQTKQELPKDVEQLMTEFNDIFLTKLPDDHAELRLEQPRAVHKIPLKDDATPVKLRAYPMSAGQSEILKQILAELIEKGYIEPAPDDSPWSAPIMLIRKHGSLPGITNQWRIVTDFRRLNELTKNAYYVPPQMTDIFDSLTNARVFSRTDVLSGYYQAGLHPDDRVKTTFTCMLPEGPKKYMYKVAALGLKGMPETFQLFMEHVLDGLKGVQAYLDDFIMYTVTREDHMQLLRQVFERCRLHKVYIHPWKCEWVQSKITFVGMCVEHNHVYISEEKVEALRNYKVPASYAELRTFVGLTLFHHDFVPKFSERTAIFTDMLKDQADHRKKFVWTQNLQQAFDDLIEAIITAPGLGIVDRAGQLVLETDASAIGLGGCLYQFVDNRLIPLHYISKKLSSAERNYSVRDREALAITYCLKKLKKYLWHTPFILYSDHQSLANFRNQKDLQGRDYRYGEIIADYEFEHRYKKGGEMGVSDALSRAFELRNETLPQWQDYNNGEGEKVVINIGAGPAEEILSEPTLKQYNQLDCLVAECRGERKGGKVDIANLTITKVISDWGKQIEIGYQHDKDCTTLINLLQKPSLEITPAEKILTKHYQLQQHQLFYIRNNQYRLVIPKINNNKLRLLLLHEAHDTRRHVGVMKTVDWLVKLFYWNTLTKDVKVYIRTCNSCNSNNDKQQIKVGSLESLELGYERFQVIQMDFITDLTTNQNGFNTILVIQCRGTKFLYLIPAKKIDTAEETTKRCFERVFSVHGLPHTLITDRDIRFTAKFFETLMFITGINHRMGASYQHNVNGALERTNKVVEIMLRHVLNQYYDKDFAEELPMIQYAYNSTIHRSTDVTPFLAVFGIERAIPGFENLQPPLNNNDNHLYPMVNRFIQHQKEIFNYTQQVLAETYTAMEIYENSSRVDVEYAIGSKVWLSTKNIAANHFKVEARKNIPRFIGPFEVIERKGHYNYKLKLPKELNKLQNEFHASLLFPEEPTMEDLQPRIEDVSDAGIKSIRTTEQEGWENENQRTFDDDGKEIYIVKEILGRRKTKRGQYQYYVAWQGYPNESDRSWINSRDMRTKEGKTLLKEYDNKCASEETVMES